MNPAEIRDSGPTVLLISKPIEPPFDDSAKNIVRTQLMHARHFSYRALTSRPTVELGFEPAVPVTAVPVYSAPSRYAPALAQNLRVMLRGLRPEGAALYHYFFAPNPVTSFAGRFQCRVAGVRSVQTICSVPASFARVLPLLFADRLIALSEDTHAKLLGAGVPAERLRLVRPAIEPIAPKTPEEKTAIRRSLGMPEGIPLVVFPGDFEFSLAAKTVAQAVPLLLERFCDITILFACRAKTAAAREIRRKIHDELASAGLLPWVRFADRVADMPSLVGACDVVVLPADSLYAKMDTPLVLLEAMSQEIPIIVANVGPLAELVATSGAIGVPPHQPLALAEAVERVLDSPTSASVLGKQQAAAVHTLFSPARMAQQIEDIYSELLS